MPRVDLFERAADLRSDFGALLLWSNALRALTRIGLRDAVLAKGCVVERTEFRAWTGALMWTLPVARLAQRAGQPTLVIRRARLLEVLAEAIGDTPIRFGHRCLGYRHSGDAVYVGFEGDAIERSELLVGADGFHSAVRARMLGLEQPRELHQIAWVGVVEHAHPLLREGTTIATLGRGLRFNAMPLGDGEIFWHATVPDPPRDRPRTKWQLAALFSDAHAPIPDLIAATPESALRRTVIRDRRPLRSWADERVVLVGDAAHPVTPDLGQGACMGLEDAVVLATELARSTDPRAACRAYVEARVARVARITELSHITATLGGLDEPSFCALRDWGVEHLLSTIAPTELDAILRFE